MDRDADLLQIGSVKTGSPGTLERGSLDGVDAFQRRFEGTVRRFERMAVSLA